MDSKQDWVADAKAMRDGQVGHHSVLKPPIPYIVSGPNFTSLTVGKCLKFESGKRRFEPGEGPSRGLHCDYEPSCGPSFEALMAVGRKQ